MNNSETWKQFESSGQIDLYLQYKRGEAANGETTDAHDTENDGAGAPRNENG